jgi:hypothetical protein
VGSVAQKKDAAREYGFLAISKRVTALTAVVAEYVGVGRKHTVTVISICVFVFPFLPP